LHRIEALQLEILFFVVILLFVALVGIFEVVSDNTICFSVLVSAFSYMQTIACTDELL